MSKDPHTEMSDAEFEEWILERIGDLTMRSFKIELRVDDLDPEKVQLVETAARIAAKHLFTTALLLSEARKPQITLQSGDMFEGEKDINLADDLD